MNRAAIIMSHPETTRLEETFASYRYALKERIRERVPLDRAVSPGNLGLPLSIIGEMAWR
jgi:hypothetical protein